MPFGIQRINARRKQPNDRITFIKPLDGPDKEYAQDFLDRIAAICNPIMKSNHLSIMSLEEYEPNPEFVGRNFNGGEVVQLVLKTRAGHWLPFKYVQMVMMHELAHNAQMNHSKAFWKVRNIYADQLRGLWGQGYTGEGLWSRGVSLITGNYETNAMADGEPLPEHLCGGTYRSGKRKRKQKPKMSNKERKERRIAKKFGTDGVALGADEETKVKLENGKRPAGKPRVAGSARGRELRAAAALARFEVKKEEPIKEEDDDDYETASSSDDDDEYGDDGHEGLHAMDINGKKLVDGKGRGMVKVCEDEDKDNADARNEMSELQDFDRFHKDPSKTSKSLGISENAAPLKPPKNAPSDGSTTNVAPGKRTIPKDVDPANDEDDFVEVRQNLTPFLTLRKSNFCPICSMENEFGASLCMVCANVLDSSKVSNSWHCQSEVCAEGDYINAGDCGVCGVCGARNGSAPNSI